jgi:hypothetical protein
MYVYMYVRAYVHKYARMCVCTYVGIYVCRSMYLHTYISHVWTTDDPRRNVQTSKACSAGHLNQKIPNKLQLVSTRL